MAWALASLPMGVVGECGGELGVWRLCERGPATPDAFILQSLFPLLVFEALRHGGDESLEERLRDLTAHLRQGGWW